MQIHHKNGGSGANTSPPQPSASAGRPPACRQLTLAGPARPDSMTFLSRTINVRGT
jgi:hypothetical protein